MPLKLIRIGQERMDRTEQADLFKLFLITLIWRVGRR
jgi:hypothetical protein